MWHLRQHTTWSVTLSACGQRGQFHCLPVANTVSYTVCLWSTWSVSLSACGQHGQFHCLPVVNVVSFTVCLWSTWSVSLSACCHLHTSVILTLVSSWYWVILTLSMRVMVILTLSTSVVTTTNLSSPLRSFTVFSAVFLGAVSWKLPLTSAEQR